MKITWKKVLAGLLVVGGLVVTILGFFFNRKPVVEKAPPLDPKLKQDQKDQEAKVEQDAVDLKQEQQEVKKEMDKASQPGKTIDDSVKDWNSGD